MMNYSATYTDQYELTMAQVYFQQGRKDEHAVFDYFFRKLPFKGGYAVFAGLESLLEILEGLVFTDRDLEYLGECGFPPDFIDYLGEFRFNGTIHASREGDLVFPTRPVLQIEGNLIETQIVETVVLNILNFQTLIATKAARMRHVAPLATLIDFGLRRAHGPGGYYASRAAAIGGIDSTSNVLAARDFGLEISGTMAHSFVQSYDREIDAFRDFAACRGHDCLLLVDTYDTLKSGVPNAIEVGREMDKRGERLKGIRLDSGDLAYLARQSRTMLDEAGLDYVKIAASNELDEHVIKSLMDQAAPIDLFGIGTSLVIGKPDAALDGVYKLAYAGGKPRIKLSETIGKITLPDKKQVYRISDSDGNWIGADAVSLRDEQSFSRMFDPFDPNNSLSFESCDKSPLLEKVMENGKRSHKVLSVAEIARFSASQLAKLPAEFKRFENPHLYKIGITPDLKNVRDKLIEKFKVR